MSDTKSIIPSCAIYGTVLNHEVQSGLSKQNNKPYHMYHYMVHCGDKFIRLTVSSPDAENPPAPVPSGSLVQVDVKCGFRDNGVIPLNGDLVKVK